MQTLHRGVLLAHEKIESFHKTIFENLKFLKYCFERLDVIYCKYLEEIPFYFLASMGMYKEKKVLFCHCNFCKLIISISDII